MRSYQIHPGLLFRQHTTDVICRIRFTNLRCASPSVNHPPSSLKAGHMLTPLVMSRMRYCWVALSAASSLVLSRPGCSLSLPCSTKMTATRFITYVIRDGAVHHMACLAADSNAELAAVRARRPTSWTRSSQGSVIHTRRSLTHILDARCSTVTAACCPRLTYGDREARRVHFVRHAMVLQERVLTPLHLQQHMGAWQKRSIQALYFGGSQREA